MATKKKSVKKKTSKKQITKKKVIKKKPTQKQIPKSKRVQITLGNIVFFGILFITSLILYMASSNEVYINLFGILSIIFGFISIAFLILLLSLFFLKFIKKNK